MVKIQANRLETNDGANASFLRGIHNFMDLLDALRGANRKYLIFFHMNFIWIAHPFVERIRWQKVFSEWFSLNFSFAIAVSFIG